MTADNEIQAMAVSGISYRRILLPAAALGIVLSVVMILLSQWVIPQFWSAIERMLEESDDARAYRAARSASEHASAPLDRLSIEAAPIERLVRAYETKRLAARLRASGGAAWTRYERFLACERAPL